MSGIIYLNQPETASNENSLLEQRGSQRTRSFGAVAASLGNIFLNQEFNAGAT